MAFFESLHWLKPAQRTKTEAPPVLSEIQDRIREFEAKLQALHEQLTKIYEDGEIKPRQLAPGQEELMQQIQFYDAKLTQLRKVEGHLKPVGDETKVIDRMVEKPFEKGI